MRLPNDGAGLAAELLAVSLRKSTPARFRLDARHRQEGVIDGAADSGGCRDLSQTRVKRKTLHGLYWSNAVECFAPPTVEFYGNLDDTVRSAYHNLSGRIRLLLYSTR